MNAANQVISQTLANGPDGSPEGVKSGFSLSVAGQQRRTDMVGHPDDSMERENDPINCSGSGNRVRRVEPRMGSVIPGHQHGWPMVSPGEVLAHKEQRSRL